VTDALHLPSDLAVAHAMIRAEREARLAVEKVQATERLLIEKLRLEIARLRRQAFGSSTEKSRKLEQLELMLEDAEETLAEAKVAAEVALAAVTPAPGLQRERRTPVRGPLPDHLPRERIVVPGPTTCSCCGGDRLVKLDEDVTETLERIPARWFVIQHVREKFSCRACETIVQPPAPFHPIARGRAGANLLAEIVTAKFGMHLPLHRQGKRFAREGVPITDSTLADWVGAVTVSLAPLVARIEDHVRAAGRIHVDDTPVPVLAKGKTRTGHLWTVVRDDRPFAGSAAPAAAYFYSPTRSGEHIESWLAAYAGLMQTDAFAGYNRLYDPGRKPGPITEAGCWAHARRKFFELADLRKAPLAAATVKAIDAIFAVERDIAGKPPDERAALRQERSRPLVNALEAQLRANRTRLSSKGDPAKAIDYMLKRWPAFVRFLDNGRLCLSNNAAERAVRGIAVGRKNWIFAGSDAGARRAAAMYTLIETAKLNDIDSRAWIADVLHRLPGHPVRAIDDLLPSNWKSARPDLVNA
jgi:transposase